MGCCVQIAAVCLVLVAQPEVRQTQGRQVQMLTTTTSSVAAESRMELLLLRIRDA